MISLLQPSHSSAATVGTVRLPSKRARVRQPRVLNQKLFTDALVREQKRADRFEEAFVLVLISLENGTLNPPRWEHLIETVSKTTLDADLIGWVEHGEVLGFVRALDDPGPAETSATVAAAIQQKLTRCLTRANADSCSIRLEIYSPHSDSIPAVLFNTGDRRRRSRKVSRDAVKRMLDVAGSTAFLISFSPIFLFVSALVKLTSTGPVFFRQQRVGEAGRPFLMVKFRTMHVNADQRIHQQYVESFIESGSTSESAKHVVFKIVDDPRVTALGYFLRRSSLDEFPQFWNVLTGKMSLVGPRPPLPYEVARYKGWHRRRVLEAKPGITGLWQVTGRSRTTFDDMVRLDLRYAKHHSVWTDLKILLATPRAVISGKGAH
jgi:lipopolysaccharide/colanic/teichoic acid biosynthesis glycosyltransferase